MALVKGASGLVVEVADEVASGLVAAGHAEYVKSKPAAAEPKRADSRPRKQ